MTNLQIIMDAMEMNKVKEEVDTYAGWKRRGFQVQKGEHAVFQTRIWRPVKGKVQEDGSEGDGKLILVNASFFGRSQVEEVKA